MSNEFICRMEDIKITSSFIVKSFTTTGRTTASDAAMRGWMERAHVEFGGLLPPSIVRVYAEYGGTMGVDGVDLSQ
jgi:hypothetical protein